MGYDRPVSSAELSQFYGEPLSASAIECGEDKVTDDITLFAEFITECSDEREACTYFGPISTPHLVTQILLNRSATDEQLAAAARELRLRLLGCYAHIVEDAAQRASEP